MRDTPRNVIHLLTDVQVQRLVDAVRSALPGARPHQLASAAISSIRELVEPGWMRAAAAVPADGTPVLFDQVVEVLKALGALGELRGHASVLNLKLIGDPRVDWLQFRCIVDDLTIGTSHDGIVDYLSDWTRLPELLEQGHLRADGFSADYTIEVARLRDWIDRISGR